MKERGIFSPQLYFSRDKKFLFASCREIRENYVDIACIDNSKKLDRYTHLGIFFTR